MGRTGKEAALRPGEFVPGGKFPQVMYGLKGIMSIFNVSKATASRYANNHIKGAVTKNGNVIIIDVHEALRLFGVKNPAKFIKH